MADITKIVLEAAKLDEDLKQRIVDNATQYAQNDDLQITKPSAQNLPSTAQEPKQSKEEPPVILSKELRDFSQGFEAALKTAPDIFGALTNPMGRVLFHSLKKAEKEGKIDLPDIVKQSFEDTPSLELNELVYLLGKLEKDDIKDPNKYVDVFKTFERYTPYKLVVAPEGKNIKPYFVEPKTGKVLKPSEVLDDETYVKLKDVQSPLEAMAVLKKVADEQGLKLAVRGDKVDNVKIGLFDEKSGKLIDFDNQDKTKLFLANTFLHLGEIGLGVLGGFGGAVVGAPAGGIGAYAGATAGGAAGAGVGAMFDEWKNKIILGEDVPAADKLVEVGKTAAERDLLYSLLLGAVAPFAYKLGRNAIDFVADMFKVGKPYADASIWKQAEKFLMKNGLTEDEVRQVINDMKKFIKVPDNKAEQAVLAGAYSDKIPESVAKSYIKTFGVDQRAAEPVIDMQNKLEKALTFLQDSIKANKPAQDIQRYENLVKKTYGLFTKVAEKKLANETFTLSDEFVEALYKLREEIPAIQDEALARSLEKVTNKLAKPVYNQELQEIEFVPKQLTFKELLDVYKTLAPFQEKAKTYEGISKLWELKNVIKTKLKQADPELAKQFEELNSLYSKMKQMPEEPFYKTFMKTKQSEIGAKFNDLMETFYKGENAPNIAKFLSKLPPEERKIYRKQMLQSLVDFSKSKAVNAPKGEFVDFRKLAKKTEELRPFAKELFEEDYPIFQTVDKMAHLFKNHSLYFKKAIESKTVGEGLISEIKRWLSWGTIRLWRELSASLVPYFYKDAALQKAFARVLKDVDDLNEFVKRASEIKGLPVTVKTTLKEYERLQNLAETLAKKNKLDSAAAYAQFGVPFGVKIDKDEKGELKVEVDTQDSLAGAVSFGLLGFIFGRKGMTPDELKKLSMVEQFKMQGIDPKEIYKRTGIYIGKDGHPRIWVSSKSFKVKSNLGLSGEKLEQVKRLEEELAKLKVMSEIAMMSGDYEMAKQFHKEHTKLVKQIENIHDFKLGDIVEDPKGILDRYPKLKNMPIRFKVLEPNENAYYNSKNKEIVINLALRDSDVFEKKVTRNIRHEMQHAIQEIEGHSVGSSQLAAITDFIVYDLKDTAFKRLLDSGADENVLNRYLVHKYGTPDEFIERYGKKVFNKYRRTYGEMEAKIAELDLSQEQIDKMRQKGETAEDFMKKLFKFKSWKDVIIRQRKDLYGKQAKE